MSDDTPLLGFAVAVNVVKLERNGKVKGERYLGTPTFSPGSKLYLGEGYWGMCESAHFIGKNRVSKKWCNCIAEFRAVENARLVGIYSEAVWAALQKFEAKCFAPGKQEEATEEINAINRWGQTARDKAAASSQSE